MKRTLLLAALPTLVLIRTTQVVHAEPAIAATAEPVARTVYVQAGSMAGVDAGVYLGGAADAGYRLSKTSLLWLHGRVGAAKETGLFNDTSGHMLEARGGVEARHAVFSDAIRFYGGADVGVRSIAITSDNAADMMKAGTHMLVTPRVGVDLGGSQIRFRIGTEVGFDALDGTFTAFDVVAGVAYER